MLVKLVQRNPMLGSAQGFQNQARVRAGAPSRPQVGKGPSQIWRGPMEDWNSSQAGAGSEPRCGQTRVENQLGWGDNQGPGRNLGPDQGQGCPGLGTGACGLESRAGQGMGSGPGETGSGWGPGGTRTGRQMWVPVVTGGPEWGEARSEVWVRTRVRPRIRSLARVRDLGRVLVGPGVRPGLQLGVSRTWG